MTINIDLERVQQRVDGSPYDPEAYAVLIPHWINDRLEEVRIASEKSTGRTYTKEQVLEEILERIIGLLPNQGAVEYPISNLPNDHRAGLNQVGIKVFT